MTDLATKTYAARDIVSLSADAFLNALNGWALEADTLALCLNEGDYGQDADQAHADRVAHHKTICEIYCESRVFVGLPGTTKALAIIAQALQADVLPNLGA